MQTQVITIELSEITAGDYLAHCRDADHALEGSRLHSVSVHSEPSAARVVAILRWDGSAPGVAAAAAAAGFHITADVVTVRSHVEVARQLERPGAALAA